MIKELPLKEQQAIELRYLGNTHQEISEKLDIPKDTIDGWFDKSGKLYQENELFVKTMNEQRREAMLEKYVESDENILTITTNIMRKIGKGVGEDVIQLNVSDYKRAWEIQRITRGLPTDIKSQNLNFNQEELDKEAEVAKNIIDSAKESQ